MSTTFNVGDILEYTRDGSVSEDFTLIMREPKGKSIVGDPAEGDLAKIINTYFVGGSNHLIVDVQFISGKYKDYTVIGIPSEYRSFFPFTRYTKNDICVPKNNDGRTHCFWCRGETKVVNTGFRWYNVCKVCRK